MECKNCGAKKVLVEGLTEGKSKVTCQECGYHEIRDPEGRKMLTDDMPQQDRRKLLIETAP